MKTIPKIFRTDKITSVDDYIRSAKQTRTLNKDKVRTACQAGWQAGQPEQQAAGL